MLMRHIHITNKIVYFPHIEHKNKTSVTREATRTTYSYNFIIKKIHFYVPLLVVLYISWYEILSETFFEYLYTKFKSFRIYISKFSNIRVF